MKLRFNVKDRGTTYEVVSINENELSFIADKVEIYNIDSWDTYEKICNELSNGNIVLIPKGMDSSVQVSDLIIDMTKDELEKQKNIAILRCKDLMYSSRLNKESILAVYTFTLLNNYFLDLGFFITDDNRESKYLEIINYASAHEDKEQEIINKLESYLSLRDKTKTFYLFYDSLINIIQEIESASTINEVDTKFNTFRAQWV